MKLARTDGGTLKIRNPKLEEFRSGGGGVKHLLTGDIKGRDEPLSLVVRTYGSVDERDRHIRARSTLQRIGHPVVEEMFKGPGSTQLAETDLKKDGGELYGLNMLRVVNNTDTSGLQHLFNPRELSMYMEYFRRDQRMDPAFLDLTSPGKLGVIKDRLRGLADNATRNSVLLPPDDPYELFVSPAGAGKIVSPDIADTLQLGSPESVRESNEQGVARFLAHLGALRDHISKEV